MVLNGTYRNKESNEWPCTPGALNHTNYLRYSTQDWEGLVDCVTDWERSSRPHVLSLECFRSLLSGRDAVPVTNPTHRDFPSQGRRLYDHHGSKHVTEQGSELLPHSLKKRNKQYIIDRKWKPNELCLYLRIIITDLSAFMRHSNIYRQKILQRLQEYWLLQFIFDRTICTLSAI